MGFKGLKRQIEAGEMMKDKSVYAQVQKSLSEQKEVNEKRLIDQGVVAERKRVFSLSVNEFLTEKLDYKLKNTTICVEATND